MQFYVKHGIIYVLFVKTNDNVERRNEKFMIISSQGFGHFTRGINNQDFGIESSRALILLDGCSGAKYSEVGTRLFAQLFSRREEWDRVETFEENVKNIFDDIIKTMGRYYPVRKDLEEEFIMENLLFTITACFETEDKYIVKLFGDGYVITQNNRDLISYMKYSYGKCPPYFAYKYCNFKDVSFKDYKFKTFIFDKKIFPKIAIATDGIMPIVKGDIGEIDIFKEHQVLIKMRIDNQKTSFYDDITIGKFDDV